MTPINQLVSQALEQLKSSPNVSNNPMAQGMVDLIESGDSARGEQMAKNLCESMGLTQDEALKQAKAFFGIPS